MLKILRGQKVFRRAIVYIVGFFIAAFGIALSITANLGVTAGSALPYIISLILGRTPGMVMTITFCSYILIQIAILRKKFRVINIFQIIPAILLGSFVDFSLWILGDFRIPTYAGQLIMMITGIILLSLGLILIFDSKFVNLPLESLADACAQVFPNRKHLCKFHVWKIIVDSVSVVTGVILALIFLGELAGIREGTFLAAVLIGKIMPYIRKVSDPVLRKIGL